MFYAFIHTIHSSIQSYVPFYVYVRFMCVLKSSCKMNIPNSKYVKVCIASFNICIKLCLIYLYEASFYDNFSAKRCINLITNKDIKQVTRRTDD